MRSLFVSLLLSLVLVTPALQAQELLCNIRVNRTALAGTEYQFIDDLQDEIRRYFNERAWTEDFFEVEERIDCTIEITFLRAEGLTEFSAQIAVGSSRPIYGTGQQTNVLQIADDAWSFSYARGQPLIFNPNGFDRFTSVLDYYAFLILGYDYDTFAPEGGNPFFEQARTIATRGQTEQARGWASPTDDRNRLGLVTQLVDPRFQRLRDAYLTYHLNILDRFAADTETAWTTALEMLRELADLDQDLNQRRYATDLFFAAKAGEIVRMLEQAPSRAEAYELLVEMDPSRQGTYDLLVQ